MERWGITAELNTRFLHPVPLEMEVSARGRVLTRNRRIFTGSGEVCLPDGAVAVRAEDKFLIQPLSAISGQDVNLPGWKVYQDGESQPASS